MIYSKISFSEQFCVYYGKWIEYIYYCISYQSIDLIFKFGSECNSSTASLNESMTEEHCAYCPLSRESGQYERIAYRQGIAIFIFSNNNNNNNHSKMIVSLAGLEENWGVTKDH